MKHFEVCDFLDVNIKGKENVISITIVDQNGPYLQFFHIFNNM